MSRETNRQTEYFGKKGLYLFPAKTKVFAWGNDAIIDIPGKKPVDITKCAPEKVTLKDGKPSIGLPITDTGSQLAREYKGVWEYLDKKDKLTLLDFEYATSHELALLIFFKSQDLIEAGRRMGEIKAALPYLINIFRNPVIHLKDVDAVLTLDAVKRVNQSTIRHLSTHSENWDNLENGNLMPRRLLTRIYEDDYGIYENIVFRDLIDQILAFLKRRTNYLAEIIDTLSESVRLEDFSRLVHSAYYLAIGKLYIGFFKTENIAEFKTMLEQTKRLYDRVASYKHRAVYVKNAHVKPIDGVIKKTNILSMHRDYKQVYLLHKKMKKSAYLPPASDAFLKYATVSCMDQQESQRGYGLFCQMLALFAAVGFNFKCDTAQTVYENGKVYAHLRYLDWSLKIEVKYNKLLDFDTIDFIVKHKTHSVKFLLIPIAYYLGQRKKKQLERIVERLHKDGAVYDKYVFLDPFYAEKNFVYDYSVALNVDGNELYYAILPVSIKEINSFRRLQKILFEAMVISNKNNDVCGFCGEPLSLDTDGIFKCAKCKTAVRDIKCGCCGLNFKAAYVDVKLKVRRKNEECGGSLTEFYKQEKRHLFRSTANMKGTSKIVLCPRCGAEN